MCGYRDVAHYYSDEHYLTKKQQLRLTKKIKLYKLVKWLSPIKPWRSGWATHHVLKIP